MATPGRVEVWFLSEAPAKASFISPLITSKYLAQSEFDSNCIPMGEGCFHPQYGMIEKDSSFKGKAHVNEVEQEDWKGKTINSLETEVVNCDKNYYFDLYCGKALKEVPKKEGLEVWIDNSGSFKSIDVPKSGDICHRQAFAEKLRNQCHGKVSFSVFTTSIKPVSDLSVICNNTGGNDTMRMIRWINDSQAKELIFITDFSEYNDKLEVYLNSIGAQIKGIGVKAMTVRDLDQLLPELVRKCAN